MEVLAENICNMLASVLLRPIELIELFVTFFLQAVMQRTLALKDLAMVRELVLLFMLNEYPHHCTEMALQL